MRERAERLGGELHLITRSGQGTRIEVTVPLGETRNPYPGCGGPSDCSRRSYHNRECAHDMTVVAQAANGRQAVELYQAPADVALLNLRMPIMSGIEAAAAIRAEFPNARIIALTTYGGDEDIRRALAAGVQSYLTKDVPPNELLKAIRGAWRGDIYSRGVGSGHYCAGVAAEPDRRELPSWN